MTEVVPSKIFSGVAELFMTGVRISKVSDIAMRGDSLTACTPTAAIQYVNSGMAKEPNIDLSSYCIWALMLEVEPETTPALPTNWPKYIEKRDAVVDASLDWRFSNDLTTIDAAKLFTDLAGYTYLDETWRTIEYTRVRESVRIGREVISKLSPRAVAEYAINEMYRAVVNETESRELDSRDKEVLDKLLTACREAPPEYGVVIAIKAAFESVVSTDYPDA